MGWGKGVCPSCPGPQPMWFSQQYGVWGNGPQNKNGVRVCGMESCAKAVGSGARGGTVEVSIGNAAGGRPFHNISC